LFAAIMRIMVGIFQALQGLIATFENEFYAATRNYLFEFDATAWGWIHLLIVLLVAFAGWGAGRPRPGGCDLTVVAAHQGLGRREQDDQPDRRGPLMTGRADCCHAVRR
jgi:hypothetical protein